MGREGSEVSREGVELRSFRGSWSRLRSMLNEPDASRSGKSGLVSSAKRRYLKLVIGSVHLWKERNGAKKVRFGADRGDGAAPLSCEVTWWIHGAPARLWVPPHLKSDTLCCKRWPCSLLMLVREKTWFWIASTATLVRCYRPPRSAPDHLQTGGADQTAAPHTPRQTPSARGSQGDDERGDVYRRRMEGGPPIDYAVVRPSARPWCPA